ncbi:hypothetical protein H5410_040293 [Solanum commersonii]|uniref:NB-ARC domain-containing protein n=1 Tax=Solanum commersonii TaxID=4109 RepID=A0A9J5XNG6_SOLCO|nr:hypothetical protein H5410_040293 [Solanum commersonii]
MQDFLEDTTKETKAIETLKIIEKRIRNVVYKAQDRVDSILESIILADREDKRQKACRSLYEELLKVEEQVYFLNKEVMLIEFHNHGSKSAELARISSSLEKSTIEENTIVGMEDDFNTILDRLTAQTHELTVIPIIGMDGIGKTTLARKVYGDSFIRSRFDKHAWVTISEEYNERQMLLELVSSITGSKQEMSDDDKLMEIVYRGLKGMGPDAKNIYFQMITIKAEILLTTRLKYVADYVNCPDYPPHSKSFLSLDDSWNLFTEKVFKKDPCPPLLEEAGKHIVQQCRGLPLSVVVVAGLLGKMDPTHDNWKKVEENLNSFFGFPEDMEIGVSNLIRLWIAEQFVKARNNKRLEMVAKEYLEELIDRSLILVGTRKANGRMRTCKIHDLLRQLCLKEAHDTENVFEEALSLAKLRNLQRRKIFIFTSRKKSTAPPTQYLENARDKTYRYEHSDWPAILDSLSLVQELKTLDIPTEAAIDPMIFSRDIFPPNLKKLILSSNTRLPCEVMNLLANLPNLEVLNGNYAFIGTSLDTR